MMEILQLLDIRLKENLQQVMVLQINTTHALEKLGPFLVILLAAIHGDIEVEFVDKPDSQLLDERSESAVAGGNPPITNYRNFRHVSAFLVVVT